MIMQRVLSSENQVITSGQVAYDRFRFYDFFVRPANSAYDDRNNEKMMLFFIIDDFLLSFIEGFDLHLVTVTNSKKIFTVDNSNIVI
jgi:hypothetical protein